MKKIIWLLSILVLSEMVILGTIQNHFLWVVLSVLWLLFGPAKFLYRRTWRQGISIWYQFVLVIGELGLVIFPWIFPFFPLLYGIVIALIFLSFFSKKEVCTRTFDISKILFFLIGIYACSTYFGMFSFLPLVSGVSLGIFSLLLIFLNPIESNSNLRLIYLILLLFAYFSYQPVCFILLIRLFLDLDVFGLNI